MSSSSQLPGAGGQCGPGPARTLHRCCITRHTCGSHATCGTSGTRRGSVGYGRGILAAAAGCGAEVAAITEAAMRGEISDYDESLRQRVLLLKGQSQHLLDRLITEKLVLNPGVERFARHARTQGLKLIVLSGGFYPIIDAVANMIQADACRANQLGHDQGRLDGRLVGPIVNAQAKATYLMDFARQWGLNPKQTIAIGDGANDLAMMAMAGLSASWRAKPLVAQQADLAFVGQGLDAMLEHFQESRSPALSRALDLVLKTHASA